MQVWEQPVSSRALNMPFCFPVAIKHYIYKGDTTDQRSRMASLLIRGDDKMFVLKGVLDLWL